MDELVEQLAVKAGIDRAVAEKTIGIMLGFLRSEGPSDKVEMLIERISGAAGAVEASTRSAGLSALMGSGLMTVGTRLMGLGLGIADIQNAARELLSFGRDRIGADSMREIVAGTPGLDRLV